MLEFCYGKVFEDALELRAVELGLDGKSNLLTELARLRGEGIAFARTLAVKDEALGALESEGRDLKARNTVLSQQLTHDRAELQVE